MLKLISATPSPYARKIRISLKEKKIPFELITEVPWNSTTQTPQYNPLEKLPVLIIPEEGIPDLSLAASQDGKPTAVYESHFIMAWIEAKLAAPRWPSMLPKDVDGQLEAQEVEVVCDGMCDAFVLRFFEIQRENPSKEWIARQQRKIDGGMKWLAEKASTSNGKEFLVRGEFGLADIAAGTVCSYLDVRWPEYAWREHHPELARYVDGLKKRESFKGTVPTPQVIDDKIKEISIVNVDHLRRLAVKIRAKPKEIASSTAPPFLTDRYQDVQRRPETKVSDGTVLDAWFLARDEITRALQEHLTTQQTLDLRSYTGDLLANRTQEKWWIGCADRCSREAHVLEDLLEYANQPQCHPYFEIDVPVGELATSTSNSPLPQLFQDLVNLAGQQSNYSRCDKADVWHMLTQVMILAFNTCDTIKICMEDARFFEPEFSVDEWDAEGGLKCRTLTTAIDPFQTMVGDPGSNVPLHVRRILAGGNGLNAVACALNHNHLSMRMRPGAVSPEDEQWLANLHHNVVVSIFRTALSLKDHRDFGDSLQSAVHELIGDGQIVGRNRLDEEYVAWYCYEFSDDIRGPYDLNIGDDDSDEEMVDADVHDVPLQAVGPRIAASSVSDVVSGAAPSIATSTVDSPCSICWDELFASTQDSCMQLRNCDHQFHAACLNEWINGVFASGHVVCPYCRKFICNARPYEAHP